MYEAKGRRVITNITNFTKNINQLTETYRFGGELFN